MNGSQALLKLLEEQGVDMMFGYPGGSTMPIYDDLLDSDIRHVLVRHEQAAAHMADGYARVLGKPGVCLSTSGPGATNMVTGVATAFVDSSPMIVLTGQVSTTSLGMDAFQEADSFSLMMPVTKHNFRLLDVKDIPEAVKRGFAIATSGRMGPVHIDLPKDVMLSEVDPIDLKVEFSPPSVNEDMSAIPAAVKLLMEAERPVILAGGGCMWANAGPEVVRLAEVLLAPVVTSMMGKGIIPEEHPLALGFLGMHGRVAAMKALTEADVVLAVGTRFSDRTHSKHNELPSTSKVIHIDVDSGEVGKHSRTKVRILGDAKKALQGILSQLNVQRKQSAWSMRIDALQRQCHCDLDIDATPILPQKVMYELSRTLPDDAIVTTEVGQNQMWAAHFLKVRHPRQFISSGGFGTMGFGFPAALGAKVAAPDRKVVDIAGDGSFLMVVQELATAVSEDIPVTICLMNNGWLGMVKQWQKLFNEERYSGTKLQSNPDFVALARSFGADGVRVDRPSELREALQRGIDSDVAFVVDIHIDPEEDVLPMLPPNPDMPMIKGRCTF
jgi:acetolactate synthase-1/2/3 large subunit